MDWMAIFLLGANGVTLVWAVKLLIRRPNWRQRLLVLTASIVSISQTVAFLCRSQGRSLEQASSAMQQCVTAMGALAAIYLLWGETRDRKRTNHMLRLAEHENQVRQGRVLHQARTVSRAPEVT